MRDRIARAGSGQSALQAVKNLFEWQMNVVGCGCEGGGLHFFETAVVKCEGFLAPRVEDPDVRHSEGRVLLALGDDPAESVLLGDNFDTDQGRGFEDVDAWIFERHADVGNATSAAVDGL